MREPRNSLRSLRRPRRYISSIAIILITSAVLFYVYEPKVLDYLYPFRDTYGIPVYIEEVARNYTEEWEQEAKQEAKEARRSTKTDKDPEPVTVIQNKVWLARNLYRVESFKQLEDDKYDIQLLNIEPPIEEDFDALRKTFYSTKYTTDNHYYLEDGVNCQGMTYYISEWCRQNKHQFKIDYSTGHVLISVLHRDEWYKFNFTTTPSVEIIKE